ncbi:hypothetical protein N0V94_009190 [Neodidymelliopsis sp. IMI 364377]|nr:hypothetical protein N0V94_009190 [Neodidymelliopsis sp. IMI 364377]
MMQARKSKDPSHVDEKVPGKATYANGDKALEFLRYNEEGGEGTDVHVGEKALVRKIDWMIVPIMFACYFLQYLDKSLLNFAAVMGIREDANLTTEQYGTLSWLFYLAFLIFEMPHAYLMQRLPTAKYLGACVCAWGVVVTCTAACDSYASLAVCRFLLGTFESAISPSLILVTSMWYKRDEQPRRIGFWFTGAGVAVMIGSLISYGFQHYTGDKFNNWQIMYLVAGLITIAAGIIVILFLPDNPMSSRLSHEEKVMAVTRLRDNNTGIENKTFKFYQFREALCDPQVWLLTFITTAASIPNGAVSSFQSVIISGFGFSNKQTALIQMPGGLITVASTLLGTYIAGRYNCRGLMLGTWVALGGIGHTKKVTTNALLLMSFCLGNILGPLTFRNADAPSYTPAKITIVAVETAVLGAVAILLVYYRWENRRRDVSAVERGEGGQVDAEFKDLTDRENEVLRYKY